MLQDIPQNLKSKKHRYRVDITNDDTFNHLFTFHISFRIFLIILITCFLGIILFTMSIIAYSPLKYYMPGVDYVAQTEHIKDLGLTIDSLNNKVAQQDKLYQILKLVIKDDLKDMKKFDSLFFNNYQRESDDYIKPTIEASTK